MTRVLRALLGITLACACDAPEPAPPAAMPAGAEHAAHLHRELGGDSASSLSLYQLEGEWTSAAGATLPLAALQGEPVLLLLFYGTCDAACPMLVRDLQKVEALLPAGTPVRFVLVTFDPAQDTPENLAAYARAKGLGGERWTLLAGSPEQVRELAVSVGVRYRPAGNGQWSHTQRISLLDHEGVVREHWDGLERPLEPIAAAAAALVYGSRKSPSGGVARPATE